MPGNHTISLVTLQWAPVLTPHTAASLVYSTASTAVQGWQKLSKMQLHRAATSLDCSAERVFGYNVHDRSLHFDRRHGDYTSAFHFDGCIPFEDCSHVTHDVTYW